MAQLGSPGIGNGQFYPYGVTWVAVDSSNNVYVADSDNSRIEKFDSDGNYLLQWGTNGSGNGQFIAPYGIAPDKTGNFIYVVDQGNNRIEKFDGNGNYLAQWAGLGGINGITGVALDSSNNVYVGDFYNNRIDKFSSDGSYLTQWGSSGNGNGPLYPEGIAIDNSNNIYVTDGVNNRVEKFDSNGTHLTQWGGSGNDHGQFNGTGGIAVDSSGNFIYVIDGGNSRLQVFVNNTNIVPPIITSQPTSQILLGGTMASFSVGVVGTLPLSYQWMYNNVALPNATNSTLTLTNVTLSDGATYAVRVTNGVGTAMSLNAVLTVVPVLYLTTQSAFPITSTGAVLNGSLKLGPDETVAWFDWGTDTNYGNIAGATILTGINSGTNISTALSGLPGNFYHYRIDAANDFGVSYGNDVSFTVGVAPTATTLAAVNSTNGTTLNATVNPNGWDTTVYFKWGFTPGLLTNSTSPIDAGAGATPLNVSSLLTGLTAAKQCAYQVVASNHLGTISGKQVAFYTPPFVSVPNENWDSIAASADGRVWVAVANPGPIDISTNSGATWTAANNAPTNGLWETVACSADGSKMIAAGGGGVGSFVFPIYTSSDLGVTWVSNNAPVANWQSVASSADGNRLVAADYHDQVIYTSTNSGAVWTQAANAPKVGWFSVALSADGTKLAAVANGSTNIFTSPDFGTTWMTNKVPAGFAQVIQRAWSSIASSADGSRLIAAAGGNGNSGFIFISTNFGASWKLTATNIVTGLVPHPWIYVASSADGSKLAAVSDATSSLGVLITSSNSGNTWTTNPVPFMDWNAVALSADGDKLVATVGYPSIGPIYVSQTTPAPVLNLSAADNDTAISWLIPSLNFTLRQSPDLVNWTDVTNLPVLNLTNLQNQVVLPAPAGNNFFRLKH